jgi:hypothetical protein
MAGKLSFLKRLKELIRCLSKACKLLDNYYGGEKLIADVKKHKNNQKKIIPFIKERTKSIKSNIELLRQENIYSKIENIEKANNLIENLVFIYIGTYWLHGKNISRQCIDITIFKEIIMEGMQALNQSINNYNAKETNFEKIKLINEAIEEHKQAVLAYLDSEEGRKFFK